jgi:predicted nucleic acid-binding Zn finger protein
MINNFPNTIKSNIIENFQFGEADAKDDKLLEKCYVPTSAISEFLEDHKDIVLGYRGAGKSAMVRLIDEKIFHFKDVEKNDAIIVVLDEEFDYRSFRNHLQRNSLKDQKEIDLVRAVWEILIIYKALIATRDCIDKSDSTLINNINEIEVSLGLAEKKIGLVEILMSTKKKVGLKFDTLHPNIVDAYVGIEPTTDSNNTNGAAILRLGEYRKYLERLLNENNKKIFILVDRLDDYVANEDYETQKILLQELLATQRIYREKCQRIRVKLFFRTDIFERLDLTALGPDKVISRCISLSWRSADIKRFLAQRTGINLLRTLEMSGFVFKIDEDSYFVQREHLALLKESKSLQSFDPLNKSHWSKLIFLVKVLLRKQQKNAGRLTDSMDLLHSEMITSVFPREVEHKRANGEIQKIDIFKFFDTHLQFSHGQTTPRSVLLFLNLFLQKARQYYSDNPDIKELSKDKNNEFPLFVKVIMPRAYAEFQKQSWNIQYQLSKDWKNLTSIIEKLSEIGVFTFKEFKKRANIDDTKASQFLAFITHTGLIKCRNEKDRHEDRIYELPILFRKCSINEIDGR